MIMNNKKVLLGVSGGIAVYKALDVISRLKKKGIEVLGGYRSIAYCDNSLRSRTYKDIQFHIKREFGVSRYEAIKKQGDMNGT